MVLGLEPHVTMSFVTDGQNIAQEPGAQVNCDNRHRTTSKHKYIWDSSTSQMP
jgi:hypothetical protein